MRRLILLLSLTILPEALFAQYFGERVLEKGFEVTDFFFKPGTLNPFGLGSFRNTAPGLLDDPLLNLSLNPAQVRLDSSSSSWFYGDFRSARKIQEQATPYYIAPWLPYAATDLAYRPYPWVYLNSRQELEPAFSGAYLFHPLSEKMPDLLVGATYQLILQDEKYYSVPQDIYRSVLGVDYAGNSAAASSTIPIVNRYSGEDDMHQLGHFLGAFGTYTVTSVGSFGLKIGRVTFDRSGGFGSSNFWGGVSQGGSTSLYSNLETRAESYSHWELRGGAEFIVSQKTRIGLAAGWLWGDAAQALKKNDSSYYNSTYSGSQSFYLNSGRTLEEWRHSGHTADLALDLRTRVAPGQSLRLLYQHEQSSVKIGLGSAIIDTSSSFYSSSGVVPPALSTSASFLRDGRSGSGEQTLSSDRILLALEWQIEDHLTLSCGAQLDWQSSEIKTTEEVLARNQSSYQSNQGPYGYLYGGEESKDLLWTFSASQTSFRIPVFLTIHASHAVDVLLGLSRSMTHSKVDDVTLALFRYRQSNSNGTITREENFGEQYTTPSEEQSDVRTTFLAGVGGAPSKHFRVRLLVTPVFQDTFDGSDLQGLQWWIGLMLTP